MTTQATYSLADIEFAINYWRSRNPGVPGVLGPEASELAEPYAGLIMNHSSELSGHSLTVAQRTALDEALRHYHNPGSPA